jgi:hypothetical protein
VPDHVAEAVVQATDSEPIHRFPDAAAMAAALAGAPSTVPTGTSTRIMPAGLAGHHEPTRVMPAAAMMPPSDERPRRGSRRAGIVAALLAACVLVVGAVALAGQLGTESDDSDPPPNVSAVEPAGPVGDSRPAVPVVTTAPTPETVPPETPAPETVTPQTEPPERPGPPAEPGASDNGNGKDKDKDNGNGRDKDDEDDEDD